MERIRGEVNLRRLGIELEEVIAQSPQAGRAQPLAHGHFLCRGCHPVFQEDPRLFGVRRTSGHTDSGRAAVGHRPGGRYRPDFDVPIPAQSAESAEHGLDAAHHRQLAVLECRFLTPLRRSNLSRLVDLMHPFKGLSNLGAKQIGVAQIVRPYHGAPEQRSHRIHVDGAEAPLIDYAVTVDITGQLAGIGDQLFGHVPITARIRHAIGIK